MTDPIDSVSPVAAPSAGGANQFASSATVQPSRPAATTDAEPDLPALAQALNQQAQDLHTSLHFQVDKTTGELVISVVDTQNNQVLMQIPNAQALAIAQSLQRLKLQLMNRTA